MIRTLVLTFALLFGATSVKAQEVDEFVNSNLLWFFYHELGHALIDTYRLPIYGQEEDAADVLSVLMINQFFTEEVARQIINNAAYGFISFAELNDDTAYADVHGPDMQRYYTMACLFIGGNFEEREELAQLYELPEERLESCEEEFYLAFDSWWPVMEGAEVEGGGDSLVFLEESSEDGVRQAMYDLFFSEVKEMNAYYVFDETIQVTIDDCGEANAFYMPDERRVVMCTEMASFLGTLLE